jgi:hypothetical protein
MHAYIFGPQTYINDPWLPLRLHTIYSSYNLSSIFWAHGVSFQVRLSSRRVRIDWEWPRKPLYFEISYTYSAKPGFSENAPRDKSSILSRPCGWGESIRSPGHAVGRAWLSWARAGGLQTWQDLLLYDTPLLPVISRDPQNTPTEIRELCARVRVAQKNTPRGPVDLQESRLSDLRSRVWDPSTPRNGDRQPVGFWFPPQTLGCVMGVCDVFGVWFARTRSSNLHPPPPRSPNRDRQGFQNFAGSHCSFRVKAVASGTAEALLTTPFRTERMCV